MTRNAMGRRRAAVRTATRSRDAALRAGVTDLLVWSIAVAVAYGTKRFYATAGAEELRWVLGPTTQLVECATGLPFAFERGVGFVSAWRRLIIAPACAGLNFFVIALLSLNIGHVAELRTPLRKAAFALASAWCAYAATVIVNAARISLGIVLSPQRTWLNAYRDHVHRVEGVVVYLTALFVLHACAQAFVERTNR